VYKTVKIGTQWWFAENLDYKSPNSVYYNDDKSTYGEYGQLYNKDDANTFCPNGWHLPKEEELNILFDYLGGKEVAGGKLKETWLSHWNSYDSTITSNESGFSAYGGGIYAGNGIFVGIKEEGTFYGGIGTSQPNANVYFSLMSRSKKVTLGSSANNIIKFSVRPVKDQ